MMNKLTILLLFLVIVGGGIYLIPKIETTKTVQYEKIEKLNCGHYDITLSNGVTYHTDIKRIDKEKQTVTIEPCSSFMLSILAWVVLVLYVWAQFTVWGVSRHFFVTDFFQAWWEYSHRPIPEEHKQAFKSFFGYS
jgi:hypothetical protein